jgi:hypothetical protein
MLGRPWLQAKAEWSQLRISDKDKSFAAIPKSALNKIDLAYQVCIIYDNSVKSFLREFSEVFIENRLIAT